jgi:hypothetical protein
LEKAQGNNFGKRFYLSIIEPASDGGVMDKPKPILAVATICEKVLQEVDGTLSAVRIVDTVVLEPIGKSAPTVPFIVSLSALISLKAGEAKGDYRVKVVPRTPSGNSLSPFETTVSLTGGESGANVVFNFVLNAKEDGLYWFDVYVEEVLFSRMPLKIQHKFASA